MKMEGGIEIQSGVPVPPRRVGSVLYPYERMKVGDSFFVEGQTKYKINDMCARNRKMGHRLKMRFIARRVTEGEKVGIRIWRTK
jgi:hypothetical protein